MTYKDELIKNSESGLTFKERIQKANSLRGAVEDASEALYRLSGRTDKSISQICFENEDNELVSNYTKAVKELNYFTSQTKNN